MGNCLEYSGQGVEPQERMNNNVSIKYGVMAAQRAPGFAGAQGDAACPILFWRQQPHVDSCAVPVHAM